MDRLHRFTYRVKFVSCVLSHATIQHDELKRHFFQHDFFKSYIILGTYQPRHPRLCRKFMAGLVGVEWPKPLKETFAGKCLRALKLDSSLFKAVSNESKSLSQAAWLLIAVNVLSGLGFGIYNLTLTKTNNSFDAVFNVLLLGQVTFDISIFTYPLIYAGIAIMKWLILSLLIYVVGAKLLGIKREFNEVAPAVAFAYVT